MGAARIMRTAAVGVVASALAVTAWAAPAQADGEQPRGSGHQATQRAMDAVVAAGVPGVQAGAKDARGVWKSTSGVGDRETGTPRGTNDRFRIGSITKTFVATVLLQMEEEGRLDLDDSVETWLPGLVRGNGNDGRKITVRQLLNHTSGLFDHTSDAAFVQRNLLAPGFLTHRYDTHRPEDLVRVGLSHRPDFAPGTRHSYSNTGYILAGLIIGKVGGNSYEHEIRERVIKPLKLRATSLPRTNPHLPQPSGRGYSRLSLDPAATTVYDVTAHNMSWGWSAGDMISTPGDINRFLSALMRGELLSPKSLAAMKTGVPTPQDELYSSYGLGLYTLRTTCDRKIWGHSGGTAGSLTEAATTEDGRHSFTYNQNGDWAYGDIVSAEFCGTTGGAARASRPLR
ncbi:serine hydrolase domain-containing protein [Streptomyces sp. NPDC057638]|uniref:serine hydrolase domain-containing protein n=1 Tax=Streptomyces sp. NPDC057638 TaxID=3346190 RepID=UPI0036844F49